MTELTERDKERYHRQIIIQDWGDEGQKKLKETKAFIAGAGGLGSPASIYLAVGGIGHINIVDKDVPELSNLNRQILHTEADIGRPKAESAEESLKALNPDITIEAVRDTITEDNVLGLVDDSDIIIDCMDNFPTRYILNKAAIELGIPFVHGSIWGIEGRTTFIIPRETPCLRCIFPDAPPAEVFPVLGAAPGVIGSIQATEALKYFTGVGRLLTDRLLIYDGERTEFSEIKVNKDSNCKDCRS